MRAASGVSGIGAQELRSTGRQDQADGLLFRGLRSQRATRSEQAGDQGPRRYFFTISSEPSLPARALFLVSINAVAV